MVGTAASYLAYRQLSLGGKVKFSLFTPLRNMGGIGVNLYLILISALDEGEWLASGPAALHLGKDPEKNLLEGWVGPRAGLEILETRKIFSSCQHSNPEPSNP